MAIGRIGVGLADQKHADHAQLGRQDGFRPAWRRSRRGRNPAAVPFDGQDQPVAVEDRIGQDQVFEDGRRHRLHQPALGGLRSPDFGQTAARRCCETDDTQSTLVPDDQSIGWARASGPKRDQLNAGLGGDQTLAGQDCPWACPQVYQYLVPLDTHREATLARSGGLS